MSTPSIHPTDQVSMTGIRETFYALYNTTASFVSSQFESITQSDTYKEWANTAEQYASSAKTYTEHNIQNLKESDLYKKVDEAISDFALNAPDYVDINSDMIKQALAATTIAATIGTAYSTKKGYGKTAILTTLVAYSSILFIGVLIGQRAANCDIIGY